IWFTIAIRIFRLLAWFVISTSIWFVRTVVVRIFGWCCDIWFTIAIFVRRCSSIWIRLIFIRNTIFVSIFATIRCTVTIRIRVSWVSTDEFFIFVVHTITIDIWILVIWCTVSICIFRLLAWFVVSTSIWFISTVV